MLISPSTGCLTSCQSWSLISSRESTDLSFFLILPLSSIFLVQLLECPSCIFLLAPLLMMSDNPCSCQFSLVLSWSWHLEDSMYIGTSIFHFINISNLQPFSTLPLMMLFKTFPITNYPWWRGRLQPTYTRICCCHRSTSSISWDESIVLVLA